MGLLVTQGEYQEGNTLKFFMTISFLLHLLIVYHLILITFDSKIFIGSSYKEQLSTC